jgi:hypothetical protein
MNALKKILRSVATAIGLALLWSTAGCDQSAQSSKPTTNPTIATATPPAQPTDVSAMVAAYPIKPPSTLSIDGRDVLFPAAKLAVIRHDNGGFMLMLCTDDPPSAIDPGYTGNSYLLNMQLGMDRLSELPAATWDCKPADSEDSTSGIYIHGYREQYHPDAVHVSFQKDGDDVLVVVSGTFLHSDPDNPASPPQHVQVSGSLRTNMPRE